MAHVGQELALGDVGAFGRQPPLLHEPEFLGQLVRGGDRKHDEQQAGDAHLGGEPGRIAGHQHRGGDGAEATNVGQDGGPGQVPGACAGDHAVHYGAGDNKDGGDHREILAAEGLPDCKGAEDEIVEGDEADRPPCPDGRGRPVLRLPRHPKAPELERLEDRVDQQPGQSEGPPCHSEEGQGDDRAESDAGSPLPGPRHHGAAKTAEIALVHVIAPSQAPESHCDHRINAFAQAWRRKTPTARSGTITAC